MSSRAHNNNVRRAMLSPKTSLTTNRYSITNTSIIAYNIVSEAIMARVTWRHTPATTKMLLTMPIGVIIRKGFPLTVSKNDMEMEICDLFASMDLHWYGEYQFHIPVKEDGE